MRDNFNPSLRHDTFHGWRNVDYALDGNFPPLNSKQKHMKLEE